MSESGALSRTSDLCLSNTAIRASAGSGKTFQLTNRYVQLAASGIEPGTILASTFTRLAAGEIRDRILSRLSKAALDAKELRDLNQHTGLTLTRQSLIDLLTTLARRMHLLQIRTLDSFFAAVVKVFAIELSIPLGAEIVDQEQDAAIRSQAIHSLLDENDPQKLIDLLRLLTQGASNRGITAAIDRVVSDLYDLYREASPDGAAWQCVPELPGRLSPPKLVEAINKLTQTACTGNKHHIKAHAQNSRDAMAWDWPTFLGGGLASKIAAGETVFQRSEIDAKLIAVYAPVVKHAIAELVGRARDQTIATRDLLALFATQYEKLKREHGAITFSDLNFAMTRAEELGQLDQIGFRLDANLHHVLLDEFQDTSITQWRALEPIVREIISVAPPERSFFCVGDVKQSIYGWRSAAPEIFDELPNLLRGADGSSAIEERDLFRSWRSSPTVIDAVNHVFLGLNNNEALAEFSEAVDAFSTGFRQHETAKTELPGRVELRVCRNANEHEDKARVRLRAAAELANELHRRNPSISIALLTRTNQAVAQLLYELGPSKLNVPVSGRGGGPLTDVAPVNVILDLLQLADHPDDTTAAFNIATSPAGPMIGLVRFNDEMRRHQVSRKVRRALVENGYGSTISQWVQNIATGCDARELRRLRELIRLADAHDNQPTLRTRDFIAVVEQTKVADVQPAPVQVMTIHQSKGLEFDAVILADVDKDLIGTHPPVVIERAGETGPITRICRYMNEETRALVPELQPLFDRQRKRTVRESLSLLYVAMTRAKQGLYMLIDPPQQNKDGSPSKRGLKTLAGIVRCALTPTGVEAGTTPFAIGDPNWVERAKPEREPVRETPPAIDRIQLAKSKTPAAMRGWAAAAASTDFDQGTLRLADAQVTLRGSAIHTLFQEIEWLEDFKADDESLRRLALEVSPRRGDKWAIEQVKAFRRMLTQPQVQQCLAKPKTQSNNTSVVHRELPFARIVDDRLQRGSIDRLTVELDKSGRPIKASILDYKTDRINAADAQTSAERHRTQLETYRDAVSEMFDLDVNAISMRVLFVEPGIAVDLP